jgi:hypothetical protein
LPTTQVQEVTFSFVLPRLRLSSEPLSRTERLVATLQRGACRGEILCVKFQVLKAAIMTIAFWDIAPYSLVEDDRRFAGANYLHRQDDRPDDGGSYISR